MRVLLVAGEFPPQQGGLGDFTRCLATALADDGCRVSVLAPIGAAPIDPTYPFTVRAEAQGWGLGDLRRLSRIAPEFDVVNLQYQVAAYGMKVPIHLLPWVLRRVPLVTTFHDLRVPYLFPKAGPVRRWAVRGLLRGSAEAIVTNEEDLAAARSDLPGARLSLVRIGSNVAPAPVSVEARRRFRDRYGIPDEALVACYFAFLNATKGGLELVQAVARARRQGVDLRLLFIGGDVGASDPTNAAYAARVFGEAEALGLGPWMHRTGYLGQEGVSTAFAASDLCALPFLDGASYRRGSLMAALAHGVPVVTTTPAVNVDGLSDGRSVRLVPPGDVEALAATLADLAGRPDERVRLGVAARELARRFEWPQIARDTLAVYRRATQPG